MLTVLLYSSLILIFNREILCLSVKHKFFGECDVEMIGIYECEHSDAYETVKMDLRTIDDDGGKSFNLVADLTSDINTDTRVSLRIDIANNGEWKEDFYSADGGFCALLELYMPKVWGKFKRDIKPPLTAYCDIKSGHYELIDFLVHADEVVVPTAVYGRFRVVSRAYDFDGNESFCHIYELTVNGH